LNKGELLVDEVFPVLRNKSSGSSGRKSSAAHAQPLYASKAKNHGGIMEVSNPISICLCTGDEALFLHHQEKGMHGIKKRAMQDNARPLHTTCDMPSMKPTNALFPAKEAHR